MVLGVQLFRAVSCEHTLWLSLSSALIPPPWKPSGVGLQPCLKGYFWLLQMPKANPEVWGGQGSPMVRDLFGGGRPMGALDFIQVRLC